MTVRTSSRVSSVGQPFEAGPALLDPDSVEEQERDPVADTRQSAGGALDGDRPVGVGHGCRSAGESEAEQAAAVRLRAADPADDGWA